jgi:hypothetical protein
MTYGDMKLKRTLWVLGIFTLGITLGGCSKTPQVTRVDPVISQQAGKQRRLK